MQNITGINNIKPIIEEKAIHLFIKWILHNNMMAEILKDTIFLSKFPYCIKDINEIIKHLPVKSLGNILEN